MEKKNTTIRYGKSGRKPTKVTSKKTAYYHVVWIYEDILKKNPKQRRRYVSLATKNLSLSGAKEALKKAVAKAMKDNSSQTPKLIKQTPMSATIRTTFHDGWRNGISEGVVYSIKRTVNPVK